MRNDIHDAHISNHKFYYTQDIFNHKNEIIFLFLSCNYVFTHVQVALP